MLWKCQITENTKVVLKIYSNFTGELPYHNFIEIALRHGCPPINLLFIFGTTFPKNTSGRLLLRNEQKP